MCSFPAFSSHLPKVCSSPAFSPHLPKVRNCLGPSVAPVPAFSFPSAFSHLPKVCGFPAFPSHLPKVRNRLGPSVAPVPAFSFPTASFHLPKVCRFPAFSPHLPKVRNLPRPSVAPVPAFSFPSAFSHLPGAQSSGTLCSACTRVFVSIRLFPPSEGVQISRISVPPSEGAQIPNRLQTFCRSFCAVYDILPIRRCRAKRYIATTFSFSLCANPHQRWLSAVLPWFPAEKVTVKSHIRRHLFGSIGYKAHLRAF